MIRSTLSTQEQLAAGLAGASALEQVGSYSAAPLLLTKLHIPSIRPNLVQRPRLLQHIEASSSSKLTLISAPAGFGKTTLLSAWRASSSGSSMPLAWLSLDADDNDPTRFWRYVVAALETVYPPVGNDVAPLLQMSQPPPLEMIVTRLINALAALPADIALVLDDYHLLTAPAIHATVTLLLDHLPARLHLIIITRADPPLPLTRLRARGELTEVRAADLRFTADEAATFLTDVMGLPLGSDEVMTLETRTEGWIAGLQLAALAMRDRSDHANFVAAFSGSNRFVVDYLVEEVLKRLPSHLQTFVLQTAILDRLCGSLCDVLVLGSEIEHSSQAYSQMVLEELERANLFIISLDDQRHWYRYHHLFAEVLRARLRGGAAAGEVATLYERASMWHETAGLIDEAVRYALLAQKSERVVSLIERHAIGLMFRTSDVLLVQSWLVQVPRALIQSRPRLILTAGFVLTLTGQFAAVEQLLADAAPALDALDLPPNTLGEIVSLRAATARFVEADPDTIYDLAEQALGHLAPDNFAFRAGAVLHMAVASIRRGEFAIAKALLSEAAALAERGGSLWVALAALEELASLQARQGQLRNIVQTAEQARQVSLRMGGQQLPASGMSQSAVAEVLYQWNDLDGAMRTATQSIDMLHRTVERLLLVRAYVVLARVYQARGDHEAALDVIKRCESWFTQTGIPAPLALAWLDAHQARLLIQAGNVAGASQWAQMGAFAEDGELHCMQQLTLAQLRMAQSHNGTTTLSIQEAHAILMKLLPVVESQGWTHYVIECLALQAAVCDMRGERTSALAALTRALTLAEPQGYVRTFVDKGTPMRELLVLLRRQPSARDLAVGIDRLLAAFEGASESAHIGRAANVSQSPIVTAQSSLVEPLTEREIEVLRLIGSGASNTAIAERLIISVATVKKHINNLYGKLAVQSRTQALVRARKLGLLD